MNNAIIILIIRFPYYWTVFVSDGEYMGYGEIPDRYR